jgi:hypothetical protein
MMLSKFQYMPPRAQGPRGGGTAVVRQPSGLFAARPMQQNQAAGLFVDLGAEFIGCLLRPANILQCAAPLPHRRQQTGKTAKDAPARRPPPQPPAAPTLQAVWRTATAYRTPDTRKHTKFCQMDNLDDDPELALALALSMAEVRP